MKKKHTIGEWKMSNTPEYFVPKSSTIQIESDLSEGWICKVQNNGVIGVEEGEANAKLIAAAPELLEACQRAMQTLEYENIYGQARMLLAVAIKKATE